MKATEFTDKTGAAIVASLKQYYKNNNKCVAGVCYYQRGEGSWYTSTEACYATAARTFGGTEYGCDKNHPDHFGIAFQGWSGACCRQGIEKPEVKLWLEHLLNPEGAFQEILPFLWHTDPEEIIADKGFVLHNALKANGGLVWTFFQATRLMYENAERMQPFLYCREQLPDDPNFALFLSLAIRPSGDLKTKNLKWNPGNCAHGEPLGQYGYALGKAFLNCEVTKRSDATDDWCTSRSYRCFGIENPEWGFKPGDTRAHYVRLPELSRPFDEWVETFRKEAFGGKRKAA